MRIRIEIEDKGYKATHEFELQDMEGTDPRERIIDLLNASGVFKEIDHPTPQVHAEKPGTLIERLANFIQYEFPDRWFSSQELRDRYETVADDIKLSTVSTYLSRLAKAGLLESRGSRNNRKYFLISNEGAIDHIHAVPIAQRKGKTGGYIRP